jgi:hypothetical protein
LKTLLILLTYLPRLLRRSASFNSGVDDMLAVVKAKVELLSVATHGLGRGGLKQQTGGSRKCLEGVEVRRSVVRHAGGPELSPGAGAG